MVELVSAKGLSSTSLMAVVTLDSISSSNLMFLPAPKPPVLARLHSRSSQAACKTEGYAQGLQTIFCTFGVQLTMTTFRSYPTFLESIAMVLLEVVQLLAQLSLGQPFSVKPRRQYHVKMRRSAASCHHSSCIRNVFCYQENDSSRPECPKTAYLWLQSSFEVDWHKLKISQYSQ